jgi:hypothetical protein
VEGLVQHEAELGVAEGAVERPLDARAAELLASRLRGARAHGQEAKLLVAGGAAQGAQRVGQVGHARLARDHGRADRRRLAAQQPLRLGEIHHQPAAKVHQQEPTGEVVQVSFERKEKDRQSLGQRQAPCR